METYKKELEKQLALLNKLVKLSDNNLKRYCDIPDECILTSSRGNVHQYYRRDLESGKRKYLRKNKLNEIRPIIQKEYERKLNNELHSQLSRVKSFLKNYDISMITDVYSKTCDAKRSLITPIIMPDEEYIEKWFHDNPSGQNTYPVKVTFETMNGENVKSKSEKIIADMLLKEGIPYVYEPRLSLDGGIYKYPDFATLNIGTRKTIYWEHFGRLSDEGYCLSNFNKLMIYERNGIVLGDNLIITMESEDMPLEIRSVKENIKSYLK